MQIVTLFIVTLFSILMIIRILHSSGLDIFGKTSAGTFLNSDSRMNASGYICSAKESVCIGAQALAFRLFVYIVSYLCLVLVARFDQSFTEWWLKWDATNYIGIAEGGYLNITINDVLELGDNVPQTLVFFPLYPAFVWIFNLIISNTEAAAIVTSTTFYVLGCIFFYKAAAYRYNKSIAEKTVILISIFPFSFYFGGMLPESTFLLTASACMYYTFRKKWWVAGVFGMFTALSRLQGILIIIFMGIEWLEEYRIFEKIKQKKWNAFFAKCIYLIPMSFTALGLFLYFIMNYINTGDFFYFLKLQKNVWGHTFKDAGTGIANIINFLLDTTVEYNLKLAVWMPQLILFAVVIYMLFRFHREHSNSLMAYLFVYTLISYSTDFIVSGGRYLSIALPLFIILGRICDRRPLLYRWIIMASLLLFVIFMHSHLSGYNMVT